MSRVVAYRKMSRVINASKICVQLQQPLGMCRSCLLNHQPRAGFYSQYEGITINPHRCLLNHQPRAGFYSKYEGITTKWMAFLSQDIDFRPMTIQKWIERRQWEALRKDHTFSEDEHVALGPDLVAAHFIVARRGAIKFEGSNNWIEAKQGGSSTLPGEKSSGYTVEAIDASGMNLFYDSFQNLRDLKGLKYLNISKCKLVDDWCMDIISSLSDSLLVLDISGIPNLTENGIAALHKLRNLRRLICHDMTSVKHPALLKLMLEEVMSSCVIDGLADYTDTSLMEMAEAIPEPVLVLPPSRIMELFKQQGDYNPHMYSKGTVLNDLKVYQGKKP